MGTNLFIERKELGVASEDLVRGSIRHFHSYYISLQWKQGGSNGLAVVWVNKLRKELRLTVLGHLVV